MSAADPLSSMRATAFWGVSTRSLGNSAIDVGAGFLLTRTSEPLLRRIAAAVSSAARDTGRVTAMEMHTKWLHRSKNPTQLFRTDCCTELSVGIWVRLLAMQVRWQILAPTVRTEIDP